MRIACLSDMHANLPALQAALTAAAGAAADRIVIAGDLVGDGPFPSETVALVRERGITEVIAGNVDQKVLEFARKKRKKLLKRVDKGGEAGKNRAWTALALGEDELEWLAALPPTLALETGGISILVVHGSPLGNTDSIYPSITVEALERKLEPVNHDPPRVLVCGHTHIPFVRTVGDTLLVNCGTVGRPADGDPRGSFALIDVIEGQPPTAEIVRFSYPVDEVVDAIAERAVPGIEASEYSRGVKS